MSAHGPTACKHGREHPLPCHECFVESAAPSAEWSPPIRWGFASSSDAELWTGSFATRDEAIAAGREEFGGEGFFIRSGQAPDPGACVPVTLADDLLDRMAENAAEWGDIAEDWPDAPGGTAEDELRNFVVAWARKHLGPTFWIANGATERVPGAAPC